MQNINFPGLIEMLVFIIDMEMGGVGGRKCVLLFNHAYYFMFYRLFDLNWIQIWEYSWFM